MVLTLHEDLPHRELCLCKGALQFRFTTTRPHHWLTKLPTKPKLAGRENKAKQYTPIGKHV